MPFIAPMIAGALGVGIIGEALIGAGLAYAMGLAAQRLGPKPRPQEHAGRGTRLGLRFDVNAEREVILGRAATAGTLVYHHLYGPNGSDYLDIVYALADCECDSLDGLIVNGKPATWNAGTGEVSEFSGTMRVRFFRGAPGQSADADLIANSGGRWTSAHKGVGQAYVYVRLIYNAELYQSGLPKIVFVVKGARLYDWRLDSTAGGAGAHRWGDPSTYSWSDNPVVCLFNWRRGIYVGANRIAGMNTPASAMPAADWSAAANVCDEMVPVAAGGTEKRYTCNGVVSTALPHREVISDILTAMAGREIDSGGTLRPQPGVAQSSVMTIADDDILTDTEVQIQGKRPRSSLVNAVFGSYPDPSLLWETVALPPRISPSDESADGGIRLEEHYALDYVTSPSQAQRIVEIFRRRHRHQGEVRMRLRPRFGVLEAGDWVVWNSARYGYVGSIWEVVTVSVGADWGASVVLREVSAAIYVWTTADELVPTAPAPVGGGAPTLTSVPAFALALAVVESGDTQRPALAASWTPITDQTVTAVIVEYRRAGTTEALSYRAVDPDAGSAMWLNGVMPDASYEARALLETTPARAVAWTSWVTASGATAPHVVSVALEAEIADPRPGSVDDAALSAQTRFELSLTTGFDTIAGSIADALARASGEAHRAGEEALRAIIAGDGVKALVRSEAVTRQSESAAFAAQISTVATTLGGHTTSIAEIAASVDGVRALWGVSIDVDGNVVGLVRLDGTASDSTFTIVADRMLVAQPGVSGGDPVPVFVIGNVGGVPKLGLRGDMLIDGSIAASRISATSLAAIVANLGTVTAGRIQNAANTSFWDLSTGEFQISA